jgi:hypothetical protein
MCVHKGTQKILSGIELKSFLHMNIKNFKKRNNPRTYSPYYTLYFQKKDL